MNHDDNRVLLRRGARELSKEEIETVNGGLLAHTNVCTFNPKTVSVDGDGCGG